LFFTGNRTFVGALVVGLPFYACSLKANSAAPRVLFAQKTSSRSKQVALDADKLVFAFCFVFELQCAPG
jgi:hypothetical protein